MICLWGTIGIMALAVSVRAADGLTQTLQHGLYEEEGNQNLDAAIKSYQSVIDQSQEQRKVVATALFRLGECYRKLGNTNEATAQYQRIIRDFSEQEQLVKLSRQNLGKAGGATPVLSGNGIPGTNPEAEELARIRAIVKDSPDLVNSRASGNTPLHTAAQSGFLSVAEFLLANGASVDADDIERRLLAIKAWSNYSWHMERTWTAGTSRDIPPSIGRRLMAIKELSKSCSRIKPMSRRLHQTTVNNRSMPRQRMAMLR